MPHAQTGFHPDYFHPHKILAILVIIVYLIFLSTVIRISPFFSQMEEASEETESMMESTGGEETTESIINRDVIPEIEVIIILSLILFGLLDGIFAFMLWGSRPPFSNEKILMPISVIQLLNRFFGGYVIVGLSTAAVVSNNSGDIMNTLYLLVIVSACVTLIIMLIIKKKVLEGKKATKILYNIPD